MRIKHGSIALILIQLFVISAMVGALFPTVSATNNDANTTTSNPDFPELPAREDIGSVRLGKFDLLDRFHRTDQLGPEFVPGEVLVGFRKGISTDLTDGMVTTGIAPVDELNKRFEVRGIERIFSDVYKLTLPEDADILSVVEEYEADPNVEFAEPNGMVHAFLVPNDPDYWRQWSHENIQSELAWNITTGDPSVLVAVVDTGIDYDHPDIAANYVDLGYDWVNNDTDPMDNHGHGTHCAGIVAAEINNYIGVAGLAQVQIMAEKVLDSEGYGTLEDVASGILHAADQGADIISMSLGAYYNSTVLYDAVKNASARNVLLVAAAGNEATSEKSYPAAYEEVVAVAATDIFDEPAWFTNFGDWIELAAPGHDIYSTMWNNYYAYMSGTSMACPHVSGVAALIWSWFGLNMTRDWVRSRLQNTTDDLGDTGFDKYYGYGRVNARWAVEPPRKHDLRLWGLQTKRVFKLGSLETINCSVRNVGESDKRNINVQLLVNGSIVDSETISFLASQEWTAVSFSWTPPDEGWYNVTSYVVPVGGERFTDNNAMSARVLVRAEEVVRVPQDYPCIQMAISVAPLRYTVQVASGTYYEHVEIGVAESLTLVGENRSSTIIDGGGKSYCIVISGDNVNITGFSLRNAIYGVVLFGSNNSSVSGNTILNNYEGVYLLLGSNNSSISGNSISNNEVGIILEFSHNNSVSGNTVLSNVDFAVGIWPMYSNYNSFSDNTVSSFGAWGDGIILDITNNSSVSGNTISNNTLNGIGIDLYLGWLMGEHSNDNTIYHNIFINNNLHANNEFASFHTWDDGVAIGNYWDDYSDKGGYDADGDGIGDAPYVIDENNQDNYPVMNPWNPQVHDVAVTNVTASDTRYGLTEVYPGWDVTGTPGWTVTINVTVKNYGFVETVNVICYYNDTIIETQENVTLYPGVNRTLTFIWNVTGVYSGSSGKDYTVKAEVSTVPGETDTDDNTMVDGTIRVKIFGDVDNNGVVDIGDVKKVQLAADGIIEEPRADLNYDGDVDDEDVRLVKRAYSGS